MPRLDISPDSEAEESDNLPAVTPNHDSLDALKGQYLSSLMTLSGDMQLFAKAMVDNGGDVPKSFAVTTYDSSTKSRTIKRLLSHTGVLTTIRFGKLIDYVENGYPLSWKRQQLQQVILECGDSSGDNFNAAGVNACMRLLAELDGDINKNNNLGATNIIITTGIIRA